MFIELKRTGYNDNDFILVNTDDISSVSVPYRNPNHIKITFKSLSNRISKEKWGNCYDDTIEFDISYDEFKNLVVEPLQISTVKDDIEHIYEVIDTLEEHIDNLYKRLQEKKND